MKSKNIEWELNQVATPLATFVDAYNKNIPVDFPHASTKSLKQFQTAFPALFKNTEEWSIDKHRKKVMDWLSSHRDLV